MGSRLSVHFGIPLFLMLCFTSLAQEGYKYSQPKAIAGDWPTASIDTLYFELSPLYKLMQELPKMEHKINSMLVVQRDSLLIEEYFNGYDLDSIHDMRSVSKSINALLLGIAIKEGFIQSIDDPAFAYLPEIEVRKNKDPRKAQITIKDLITMSSGLACDDWDKKSPGQEDRVYKKKDWLQTFADLPVLEDPGTTAAYCSIGQLWVKQIISETSGLSYSEFAKKYLFEPLGIKSVSWSHTSKRKDLPDSHKRLYLRPRDMAKLGQLVLKKGNWEGLQVIPEQWIDQMTQSHTSITGMPYGYLWWTLTFNLKGNPYKAYTATGNGGQYILVIPQIDFVAVFTGSAFNSQEDKIPFAIVQDIWLPIFFYQ